MPLDALRHLLSSFLGLAGIIAISLGVVWLVWYVATTWTLLYTVLAVMAIVILSAYGIVRNVGRRSPDRSRIPPQVTGKVVSGSAGSAAGNAGRGDAAGEL